MTNLGRLEVHMTSDFHIFVNRIQKNVSPMMNQKKHPTTVVTMQKLSRLLRLLNIVQTSHVLIQVIKSTLSHGTMSTYMQSHQ